MKNFIKQITFRVTNHSSFSKVLRAQIIFALIPLVLVSVVSYYISENIVNKQILNLNKASYSQIKDTVSDVADSMYKLISIISVDTDVTSNLQKDFTTNRSGYLLTSDEISHTMSIYSIPLFNSYPMIYAASDAGNIFYTNTNALGATAPFDILTKKDWYNSLLNADNQFIWMVEDPGIKLGGNYITAIKSLSNQFTKHKYGVLMISIKEDYLYNKYESFLDDSTAISILDNNGNYVSSSNRSLIGTAAPNDLMHDVSLRTKDEMYIRQNNNSIEFISNIPKTDWSCIYTVQTSRNLSDIYTLRSWFVGLLVLGLLLYYVLSRLILRIFTKPLVQLNRKFQGHLVSVPNVHANKLNNVDQYENYDLLLSALDDTLLEIQRQEEARYKAEIHALQMQINPHFIANTLNTIKCLYWTGRTEQIIPITDALIQLFRRSIGNLDEMVTIKEELDCIKSYIAIQEIRNDNPINFTAHVSPALENQMIPKLILQPIVENAVFHGLEPKNGPGSITVFVTKSDNMLTIEVDDDGVGISLENTDSIGHTVSGKDDHLHGIGISNIKERLALVYKNQAQFSISSILGTGTQVILRLPITEEKQKDDTK